MQEIEKDLVRWERRQWFVAVALVLVAQVGLLLVTAKIPANPSVASITKEQGNRFRFALSPALETTARSEEIQDAMLFAEPSWKGFSGAAWMVKPPWSAPNLHDLPPAEFLAFDEVREILRARLGEERLALGRHRRPGLRPWDPPLINTSASRSSELKVEGFGGRELAGPSAQFVPPVQYFNDAVGRSVVEAILDPDGWVLSARLIETSGSKKADLDAVSLARGLRFDAAKGSSAEAEKAVVVGKLIFDWHALNLSQANSVPQP